MFQIDDMQVLVSQANLKSPLSNSNLKKIIVELNALENKEYKNCHFLLLDARAVAGINHLKACIHYGLQAFKQKNNLAKTINAEILVYLSGYRQISRAIELVGLNDTSKEIIFVVISPNLKNCSDFNLTPSLIRYR
ncbi:MAG: KEOPS complex subunit Cgi121 [Candidatus Thorarchaeota archaeon]